MGAAKALCGREKGSPVFWVRDRIPVITMERRCEEQSRTGLCAGRRGQRGLTWAGKWCSIFLYKTFDADLMDRFQAKFDTNSDEILTAVYKKPLPNRYLLHSPFSGREPRALHDREHHRGRVQRFFFNHIYKYRESWTQPIHFTGSVAHGFRDVLKDLCNPYELELGRVIQKAHGWAG